jgi:hypothetical protein
LCAACSASRLRPIGELQACGASDASLRDPGSGKPAVPAVHDRQSHDLPIAPNLRRQEFSASGTTRSGWRLSHAGRADRSRSRMDQSMSRTACCHDNAPSIFGRCHQVMSAPLTGESFFHTLKVELVHQRRRATRDQTRRDLFAAIEGYDNTGSASTQPCATSRTNRPNGKRAKPSVRHIGGGSVECCWKAEDAHEGVGHLLIAGGDRAALLQIGPKALNPIAVIVDPSGTGNGCVVPLRWDHRPRGLVPDVLSEGMAGMAAVIHSPPWRTRRLGEQVDSFWQVISLSGCQAEGDGPVGAPLPLLEPLWPPSNGLEYWCCPGRSCQAARLAPAPSPAGVPMPSLPISR